jgi:hypothetical protein
MVASLRYPEVVGFGYAEAQEAFEYSEAQVAHALSALDAAQRLSASGSKYPAVSSKVCVDM